MSGLTSPCQVNFAGVSVFLEGGQKPCFRTHCGAVPFGKHGEATSWVRVSILVDPSFIRAAAGSAHLEPSEANQPR